MNGPSFQTRSATRDEMLQTVACIVAAFITDPLARFLWPSPYDYLHAMPSLTREYASGSFEHGSAFVSANFGGAALWLPPSVSPSTEALERLFRGPRSLSDWMMCEPASSKWKRGVRRSPTGTYPLLA